MKVLFVVLDMVAKAALLNQTQFNGAYGCPQCLARGKSAETKRVWIYPFNRCYEKRSQLQRVSHLEKVIGGQPFYGLKGKFLHY